MKSTLITVSVLVHADHEDAAEQQVYAALRHAYERDEIDYDNLVVETTETLDNATS